MEALSSSLDVGRGIKMIPMSQHFLVLRLMRDRSRLILRRVPEAEYGCERRPSRRLRWRRSRVGHRDIGCDIRRIRMQSSSRAGV